MIVIIDYGRGNLRSVQKSLEINGIKSEISSSAEQIYNAKGVIFPGVGAFRDAMEALKQRGLIEPLKQFIESGKPFLGICLGLQLLFEYGTEYGKTAGLAVFEGKVIKFRSKKLRIPHMGWNRVHFKSDSKLFEGIKQDSYFYFVHSYYAEPKYKNEILAKTEYGCQFSSAINRENIYAVQFHPEKSAENGLKIIKNFGEIVNEYHSGN